MCFSVTITPVNSRQLPAFISVFWLFVGVITELSRTKLRLLVRKQLWAGYHGDTCLIHTIGRWVRTLPLHERDVVHGNVALDSWTTNSLENDLSPNRQNINIK